MSRALTVRTPRHVGHVIGSRRLGTTLPSTRPNVRMVTVQRGRGVPMKTRAIAQKALKMAGRPDIYNVTVANVYSNFRSNSVAVHNLMNNFTTSATEQGDGNFSGNKIFLRNLEYSMHWNAEPITQSDLVAAPDQYIKPLWVTVIIVQTFFSPLQNRSFTSNAILESLVSPTQSKYTPSTNENYLGKYKVLHREDIKIAGIVNPDVINVSPDDIVRPMYNPCGKIGLGQYHKQGSIKINKTIKFQPDNDPSMGLKCIVISGNSVLNSTLWGFDGASLFRMWYTDS